MLLSELYKELIANWGKKKMTQLLVIDGDLHLNEDILLVRYPEGDVDTIPFPFKKDKDRKNLASALYDSYEFGEIDERVVLLPDGTEFDIDANLGS